MHNLKHIDSAQNTLSIKVILVENDYTAMISFLEKFKNKLSIQVIGSIAKCLEFMKNTSLPDAVIISENMGGIKFLETIRSEHWTHTLPIIITSDQITQRLVREVLQKKGDDLFPHDFSKGDLVDRLKYFIKRRHFQSIQPKKSSVFELTIPFWKRAIDVISTGTALLLLSPILSVVSILIKLDSKGPVVYKSLRVGAGYKVFGIYKFRTMRTDADQLIKNMRSFNMYTKEINDRKIDGLYDECSPKGECQKKLFINGEIIYEKAFSAEKKEKVAFIKFQNDPRITKFGSFLRNSSIDELPQLFNILMGDMSLIGNRPLPLYEAEKLTTDKYIEHFTGHSGLTGLWQVTKRGKGKKEITEEEEVLLCLGNISI